MRLGVKWPPNQSGNLVKTLLWNYQRSMKQRVNDTDAENKGEQKKRRSFPPVKNVYFRQVGGSAIAGDKVKRFVSGN